MTTSAKARELAVQYHRDQRYGEHPYVKHLDDVAELCKPYGTMPTIVAYLHDALEDTDLPIPMIDRLFGVVVRQCVQAVTDEPGETRAERKDATYRKLAGVILTPALIVKAADRLANVRCSNKNRLKMYRAEHTVFRAAVLRPGVNDAMVWEIDRLLG